MQGLVIDEPWISEILAGRKDWEMRKTRTTKRETFALIRKGTGKIVGTARLVECRGPFDRESMKAAYEHHRIPIEHIKSALEKGWRYAWVLTDVRVLERPVPYRHPNGAVIWVNLDSATNQLVTGTASRPVTAEAAVKTRRANPARPAKPAVRRQRNLWNSWGGHRSKKKEKRYRPWTLGDFLSIPCMFIFFIWLLSVFN